LQQGEGSAEDDNVPSSGWKAHEKDGGAIWSNGEHVMQVVQ
jgi:hypothetical protein